MSVPEARGGASPPSGSTSMVRRRRCRHGLAMLHISAQLHRQQLRPAVRHTAEHSHHARYSCRCRWCHCVRPCSWPWSTSVRKSFALLHVQLHHARDRSSRSAGAVSRVVPHGGRTATAVWTIRSGCGPNAVSRSVLSAVSHTVVRRPSGATAGLITVEFNYELSYITTESLISIHPLAPLTRWHHAVCAQSAYRVHTAIVLSENERSCMIPIWD